MLRGRLQCMRDMLTSHPLQRGRADNVATEHGQSVRPWLSLKGYIHNQRTGVAGNSGAARAAGSARKPRARTPREQDGDSSGLKS